MKIRNATKKDAKGVANVLIQSYNIKDAKDGMIAFKEELQKKYHFIVAVDKGKVVGLTTWQVHGLYKHQLCELDRIAVLPECRGKGTAKKLFAALIKAAKAEYKKHGSKLRKLYLLTHASNIRAHKFYEKMGFKHEATLKSHYYKKENEWVYSMFF
jgi:ribosomal protein S18 acetylase RimI-like enzyme